MDGAGKGWVPLWLMGMVLLVGCGHRLVSALGNPGDHCTMPEACPEGTQCVELEDGFRCVAEDDDQGRPSRSTASSPSASGRSAAGPAVEEDRSEDDEAVSEGETDGETADDDEDYEPPSSRRRRQQ
jgi:hypothetical protein